MGKSDEWLPTLLRQLEDTKTVVFHCALSKQRGPSAALRYIREREAKFGEDSVAAPEGTGTQGQQASAPAPAGEQQEQKGGNGAGKTVPVAQKVCVLRGGFLGQPLFERSASRPRDIRDVLLQTAFGTEAPTAFEGLYHASDASADTPPLRKVCVLLVRELDGAR